MDETACLTGKEDQSTMMRKKILSLLLVCSLLCSLVPSALASSFLPRKTMEEPPSSGFSDDANAYEIYPTPRAVSYPAGQAFSVTETVNAVIEPGIDRETVQFLADILGGYGIALTQSDTFSAEHTNILLGVKASGGMVDAYAEQAVTLANEDLFAQIDPYLLTASTQAAPHGVFTILGKDTACVYYGLTTLKMMFSSFAGQRFLPVQIEDYAGMRYRGVIEGFYGGWSQENRISLMEFVRDVKMNRYVYASKTDPYHTDKWDTLYPQADLEQMEQLVGEGRKNKVEFCWSVHIGKFFKTGGDYTIAGNPDLYEKNLQALFAKFDQLYQIGVRQFALLNDDFPSGSLDDLTALLNDVMARYVDERESCSPIIYCPRGYNEEWSKWAGYGDNGKELQALKKADRRILIFWTGSAVNSPITQDTVNFLTDRTTDGEGNGLKPMFWLNYPVNEHDRTGMFLGNIAHYARNDVSGLAGAVSNPSTFAQSAKVALFQLASLFWNNHDFSSTSEQLWEDCFQYIQPEVADSLRTIARNISTCPNSGRVEPYPESEYLAQRLDAVQAKAESGTLQSGDADAAFLLEEFSNILSALTDFDKNCLNRPLAEELAPWLGSLQDAVTAAKGGLEAALALSQNDLDTAWAGLSRAGTAMETWKHPYIANYDGADHTIYAEGGSKRIAPFATALINDVNRRITPLLSPDGLDATPALYAVMGGQAQKETEDSAKMFDGDPATYASYAVKQQAGDYFGVDLGRVKSIRSISILQGKDDTHHDYFHKATLECSSDGETWTVLAPLVNSKRISLSDLSFSTRYIRLRLAETGYGEKPDYWTYVREFSVETAAASSVYANLSLPNDIRVSVDGGVYTLPALTGLTLKQGEYVGLALPSIEGVKAVSMNGDLPQGLTLQYSANGVVWTDGAPDQTVALRYARMICLGETPVTGDLPSLTVETAEKKLQVSFVKSNAGSLHHGSWENAFDGDATTYVQNNVNQAPGQYFIFDLGGELPVYDLKFYSNETNDYLYYMDISLGSSSDPEGDWHTVGSIENDMTISPPYKVFSCHAGGLSARYLKLEITKAPPKNQWMILNEVEINQTHQQETSLGALSGSPTGAFENTVDGDLSTFLAIDSIPAAGGFFQYLFSGNTRPKSITILQAPQRVCNAEVQVQAASGGWRTLGQLDQSMNRFDTADLGDLLALRLNWVKHSSPAIAEILLDGSGDTDPPGQIPPLLPSIYEPAATTVDGVRVDYATPFSDVDLPGQAAVTLSGKSIDALPSVSLPILWTCSDYDAETPGTYTATGTYDLGDALINPGGFSLTASVTVNPPSTGPDEPFVGNLALNRPVEVSGYEPEGPQGNKDVVVDGISDSTDINARWSSGYMKGPGLVDGQQTPAWVTVDLGEQVTEISEVKAYYHAKVWPTDYDMQFSSDGEQWTTVKTITRAAGSLSNDPVDTVDSFDAELPENARYLRLYFRTLNTDAGGNAVALKELEVEGTRSASQEVGPSENLALNHPVYVSGMDTAGSTVPEEAVDGDINTRWSSNHMKTGKDDTAQHTSDAWIVVDLGEDVAEVETLSLSYYNLVWPKGYLVQAADSSFTPKDFRENVSLPSPVTKEDAFTGQNAKDADCWTTVKSFKNLEQASHPTDSVSSFDVPVPAGTRYIRLYFTQINPHAGGNGIGLNEFTVNGTRHLAPADFSAASKGASVTPIAFRLR